MHTDQVVRTQERSDYNLRTIAQMFILDCTRSIAAKKKQQQQIRTSVENDW